MAIDDVVNVSFDVESREYNGRWYTTVRAWKVDKNVATTPSVPVSVVSGTPFDGTPAASEGSDLPF